MSRKRGHELAERLVSPGPFPNMSASEGHELYDYICALEKGEQSEAPAEAMKFSANLNCKCDCHDRFQVPQCGPCCYPKVEVSAPRPTLEQQVAELTADNERLTKERDEAKQNAKTDGEVLYMALARSVIHMILEFPVECEPAGDIRLRLHCIMDKAKRAEQSESDNERLRGALQRIAELDYSKAAVNCAAYDATQIAREALKK